MSTEPARERSVEREAIHDVPPVMRCEQCKAKRGVTDEWGPWLCEDCAASTDKGDSGMTDEASHA